MQCGTGNSEVTHDMKPTDALAEILEEIGAARHGDFVPVELEPGAGSHIAQDGSYIQVDPAFPEQSDLALDGPNELRIVTDLHDHEDAHYRYSDLESKETFMREYPEAPTAAGAVVNILEDQYVDAQRVRVSPGRRRSRALCAKAIMETEEWSPSLADVDGPGAYIEGLKQLAIGGYVRGYDDAPEGVKQFLASVAPKIEAVREEHDPDAREAIAHDVMDLLYDHIQQDTGVDPTDLPADAGQERGAARIPEDVAEAIQEAAEQADEQTGGQNAADANVAVIPPDDWPDDQGADAGQPDTEPDAIVDLRDQGDGPDAPDADADADTAAEDGDSGGATPGGDTAEDGETGPGESGAGDEGGMDADAGGPGDAGDGAGDQGGADAGGQAGADADGGGMDAGQAGAGADAGTPGDAGADAGGAPSGQTGGGQPGAGPGDTGTDRDQRVEDLAGRGPDATAEKYDVDPEDVDRVTQSDERRWTTYQEKLEEFNTRVEARKRERDDRIDRHYDAQGHADNLRQTARKEGVISDVEDRFREYITRDQPRPSREGTRLDTRNVVRRVAGDVGEDQLYQRQKPVETGDRTIGVALDISGSMNGDLDEAKVALAAIAKACETVGDSFVGGAFTTVEGAYDRQAGSRKSRLDGYGPEDALDIRLVTGPDEDFEWEQLASLTAEQYTPTAPGMRFTRALMDEVHTTKEELLIVITDGTPNVTNEADYVGDGGTKAVQQCTDAAEQYRAEGTGVVAIGIGDVDMGLLEAAFGAENCVDSNIRDLADDLIRVYEEQLDSNAGRRR